MLQAMNQEKHMITLAALSKAEIQTWRGQKFFCPACHEQVIVKAGERNIPHFAHQRNSRCPAVHKGEGPFHEKGKLRLFQWLRNQFADVGLETYLQKLKQRPDILLRIGQKTIAVEFQCAKIPLREIRKRNSRYQLAGIRPIWILGANLFQRKGKRYLSVNPFILTFLHQFRSSQPTALYFYCPDSNIMIQASDLHLISPHRAIACYSYFPLSAIRFTDIFHHFSFQRPMLIRHWFQEKRTFRLRKRTYAKGRGKQWQHWLYQQRSTIDNLPAVVYLPVPSAYLFHTALWDWQSRICLGLLQYVPLNAHFTTTACEELLQNQLQAPSNFPMVKPLQHPISEYLSILCQLQIIKEEKPGCFRKVKELQQAKNIESALHEDQKLLNILLRQ